jgi:hypothetical protein
MPYSSTIGPSRGAKRTGRWFVLVFLCVALVLVLVPAVSLGWGNTTKVTLKASPASVVAGDTVKLTATASPCPSGATFTLQSRPAKDGSWADVATSPAGKCGTAVFKVTPMCDTRYQVILKWSHCSAMSNPVCVTVRAKLTLCVKPGMYGGGVCIKGTLVPGWTGGKVCIRIAKVVHCNRTVKVATLSVPLTQGPGNSSVYATTWAGAHSNTTYVFTARAKNACAIRVIKL